MLLLLLLSLSGLPTVASYASTHLQDVSRVVLIQPEGGLLRCIWPAELHAILRRPLLHMTNRVHSLVSDACLCSKDSSMRCPTKPTSAAAAAVAHLNGIPQGNVWGQLQVSKP